MFKVHVQKFLLTQVDFTAIAKQFAAPLNDNQYTVNLQLLCCAPQLSFSFKKMWSRLIKQIIAWSCNVPNLATHANFLLTAFKKLYHSKWKQDRCLKLLKSLDSSYSHPLTGWFVLYEASLLSLWVFVFLNSINMLEVNSTLALHKIPPSVITICRKALPLHAAKQHSRFPAKSDTVAHSEAVEVGVDRKLWLILKTMFRDHFCGLQL